MVLSSGWGFRGREATIQTYPCGGKTPLSRNSKKKKNLWVVVLTTENKCMSRKEREEKEGAREKKNEVLFLFERGGMKKGVRVRGYSRW